MFLIKESPEKDPWITEQEKQYIQQSLNTEDSSEVKSSPPWKAILTSTAVWAIAASHFSENWGFYTLLTQLPKFLKSNIELNILLFVNLIQFKSRYFEL